MSPSRPFILRPIATSLLFLGCRDPEDDLLYADELKAYEADGVATLIPAFSRVKGYAHRYVQHALEASARKRGIPINALVAEIDVSRLDADRPPNLTSAIRQWLFDSGLRG